MVGRRLASRTSVCGDATQLTTAPTSQLQSADDESDSNGILLTSTGSSDFNRIFRLQRISRLPRKPLRLPRNPPLTAAFSIADRPLTNTQLTGCPTISGDYPGQTRNTFLRLSGFTLVTQGS